MAVDYNKNSICKIKYKKGEISSKAVAAFLKQLEKHYTTIGIHSDEDAKVVKNACLQEFGNEDNPQIVEKTRHFKSPHTGKWFHIKKGTKLTVPARPFVRILNKKSEKDIITDLFKYYVAKHEKDGNWKAVYDTIGKYSEMRMKERIASREIKVPIRTKTNEDGETIYLNKDGYNAEMTKEYKASSTPLILKGTLYNAIKHEVH